MALYSDAAAASGTFFWILALFSFISSRTSVIYEALHEASYSPLYAAISGGDEELPHQKREIRTQSISKNRLMFNIRLPIEPEHAYPEISHFFSFGG